MKFWTIILIINMGALVACAQLNELQDRSAEKIAEAIDQYCANTDEDFRSGLREDINGKTAGHSIAITCADTP